MTSYNSLSPSTSIFHLFEFLWLTTLVVFLVNRFSQSFGSPGAVAAYSLSLQQIIQITTGISNVFGKGTRERLPIDLCKAIALQTSYFVLNTLSQKTW